MEERQFIILMDAIREQNTLLQCLVRLGVQDASSNGTFPVREERARMHLLKHIKDLTGIKPE
jgi:hypothetical protein